jgi:hypothetical protein
MYNVYNVNILYILTTEILLLTMTLTNDRHVLSSERAPHKNKTVTVKSNLISGARHQDRLTDLLTDRQQQCDFDFKNRQWEGSCRSERT